MLVGLNLPGQVQLDVVYAFPPQPIRCFLCTLQTFIIAGREFADFAVFVAFIVLWL